MNATIATQTPNGGSLHPIVRRQFGDCTMILADCLDVLPIACDVVVTDPPYPNMTGRVSEYHQSDIKWLESMPCRQFIFWHSKGEFPMSHQAVHIWDKKTGCQSEYERIFERNSQNGHWKVFRRYLINSTIAAQYARDVYTGHPSQKPMMLICDILGMCKGAETVCDPYMGSGTTAIACIRTGRKFVGIEKDVKHFETACERVANELAQGVLLPPNK